MPRRPCQGGVSGLVLVMGGEERSGMERGGEEMGGLAHVDPFEVSLRVGGHSAAAGPW